ncbi:histidine phosphatase family protein [Lacticaseibacillus sp. GG6-2]
MTEFYFVRHGETLVNARHAFNGGLVDEPLTTQGVAAAEAVGQALAPVAFTQIISSSMPRALTTAQIILAANQHRPPLSPAAGLEEMRLGQWDGHTVEEVAQPEALKVYFSDPARFDADYAARYGIEPYHHALHRSRAVIAAAYAAHPSGKLLVVGHGLVFQLLLNTLLGVPFARLREPAMLHNATISQLDTRDGQHFVKRQWDYRPID